MAIQAEGRIRVRSTGISRRARIRLPGPHSVFVLGLLLALTTPGGAAKIDYIRGIRPILSEKCYVCHGPAQQIAGLRLDRKEGRTAVASGGTESELVRRITSKDVSYRMPPWPAALSFTPKDVEMLKTWAAEGAPGDDPPAPSRQTVNLLTAIDGGDLAAVRSVLQKDRRLINNRDAGGASPLMHAVLNAAPDCVKLLLRAGADPNLRNYDGATALIWAADSLDNTKLLLAAGADVNARTSHGGTALLAASLAYGSGQIVAELLKHGAVVNATDPDGWTPLIRAAASGDTDTLAQLIPRNDLNAAAIGLNGMTAAMWYGNLESVRLLLSKGAAVDGRDGAGFTPLSVAALWAREKIAALLLESGAAVNLPVTDTQFMRRTAGTPLMLASYAEARDIRTVQLLLAHGADVHFTTQEGESAATRAAVKGRSPILAELLAAGAAQPQVAAVPVLSTEVDGPLPDSHTAVERGLALLQRGDAAFFSVTGCKSCHNQSLPAMALGLAEERGFRYDREAARKQAAIVAEAMHSQRERVLQMMDDEGPPESGSYALAGLAAGGYPADATTAAFVRNIAARQLSGGNWQPLSARPPLECSDVSTTALAIHALRLYGAGRRAPDYERRIAQARRWLIGIKPRYTDESAFQILGLRWSGLDTGAVRPLAAALMNEQRPDGGWGQLPTLASDSFATGQVLYALNQGAGLSTADPIYQRGVKFLRETQRADGSWLVASHVIPIQPPFDAKFPYGADQFISAAGTSWAAMALMLTEPPREK